MRVFVGIDLGTTNSAICSFDGESVHLYKSPEQNDVTPSAILIDRRGNRYVGQRAYNNAPSNPGSAAMLFKRLIGTSTPIELPTVNLVMTPEECSAEIIRTMYGYLPEDVRADEGTGTVITVPAAFNQMQKDATSSAAEMAGLGRVALMQEPVAAVMAVMRERPTDGRFVVFDLGGGTLDVAVAESVSGRVSLLSHGGIAMCGGRDFDRLLVEKIVKPWLQDNFDIPDLSGSDGRHRLLLTKATWAAEKAKIELSAREEAVIGSTETELGFRDEAGAEVYLDIPLNRNMLDDLIAEMVDESIQATRDTLEKVGLTPNDIERIVFIGGPTNYKPLRDRVAVELGIAASTAVNPMTAVAEGAAVFAESIDWSTKTRTRKPSRGSLMTGGSLEVSFNYMARTPGVKARVAAIVSGNPAPGTEFQLDSLDTAWSSGRVPLQDQQTIDVPLAKAGQNTFKVFLFDETGGPVSLEESRIVITRTAATIDAIPASSSIGIEALDKLGGRQVLQYLVREGDVLPKKGRTPFKAAESLTAGSANSLRFRVWEGEIVDPVSDNRFVGTMEIKGTDLDGSVIPAGAELLCDFEVTDSGNIVLEVSIPAIRGTFHGRNFYSRQAGELDFSSSNQKVIEDANHLRERADAVADRVEDPRLERVFAKLDAAERIEDQELDPEASKQAMDRIQEAKKLLGQVREGNLPELRQMDLDHCVGFFDEVVKQYARPTEVTAFDNLTRTAQRAIDKGGTEFENLLDELRGRNYEILWRQDWFIVDRFKGFAREPWRFPDRAELDQLVQAGSVAIETDDMEKLRTVVGLMEVSRVSSGGERDLLATANIVRG